MYEPKPFITDREQKKAFQQSKSSQNNTDFFYYEAEKFKNYKYKLYNIELAEIERKKLHGMKIYVSDYNFPLEQVDQKSKNRGFGIKHSYTKESLPPKKENINESKSLHERKTNKINILNKINKLSMDLKIENSKKLGTEPIENKKLNESNQNLSLLPKLEKSEKGKNELKKHDAMKLLNGRLMSIIKKKQTGFLPSLNTTNKNTSHHQTNSIIEQDTSQLYRKKIGGGFTLIVKKNELNKKGQNRSVIIDRSLFQESNSKGVGLNEQIGQIIKSRKIQKNKNQTELRIKQKKQRTIYEEFIFLAKITQETLQKEEPEKFVSIAIFRENFSVFKNNKEDIGKRIMVAFGINPFEQNFKIQWEPFSRFMKVLVNRESSILERVNFICKFFSPNEKNKTIKIEEFLAVLKSLVLKLGEGNSLCATLFNLYIQVLQNFNVLNEKSNQIAIDDFRQTLINNEININDLLDLITDTFE